MYLNHFGLTAQPFQLTPDIGFLFMSEAHSRAKAYMDYSVWNREGFVVITGEIGCGKTTLIQKLLSELNDPVMVAKIFQTQLDDVEFLQSVLVEFGLNPFSAQKVELLDMLNTFLIQHFVQGKQIVLIVDDAHNLSTKVLEELRMLAGLETRKEKILHVILVGQPQLNEILDQPDLEQLSQRVKLRYHIRVLSEQELGQYIHYRLSAAGAADRTLFLPETLPVIYKYAGGTPRLINILCDAALTCAYADNLPKITAKVVEEAASELQWPSYSERVDRRRHKIAQRPIDSRLHDVLSEQSRSLATIAAQVGKLDDLSPVLASIRMSLAAIEAALRDFVQSQAGEPQSGPAVSRRKTGL
jgi:type II secretory pathway predicted ATPase ExeA